MNLVNLQGAGEVAITPTSMRREVGEALERLDPPGSWRAWWHRAAGEPVELIDGPPSQLLPTPVHGFGPFEREAGAAPQLGINIGGHYLRLVRIHRGKVVDSREKRLGSGRQSSLFGISLRSFLEMLTGDELAHGVRSVGIAWSAPRTRVGLRAMSILTQGGGEVVGLLDTGELDSVLTKALGCPVRSWNDGEAVAAAEALARPGGRDRPLLVLKLGTSFASGLVLGAHKVSALPMQLSKCLPRTVPSERFAHPMVGLHGTARDALGAACVSEAFRLLTGRTRADFEDYCLATLRGDPVATRLARSAARTVAEMAHFVSRLWSPVDLVLSGRNLRQLPYRQKFTELVRHELARFPSGITLLDPAGEVSLSAALGAAALSRAHA
uniref:hypothetical protein n=1 Tax=Streptomyces hawaiiensis TaxID=67305 RepID=UPI0031DEE30B